MNESKKMTTTDELNKENSNDLQSYLESFNKEIETVESIERLMDPPKEVEIEEGEEGAYFIDQIGNYYYRTIKNSESMLTEGIDENEIEAENVFEMREQVIDNINTQNYDEQEEEQKDEDTIIVKKRGRKKGTKNKPKPTKDETSYLLIMDDDIKRDDADDDDEGLLENNRGFKFEKQDFIISEDLGIRLVKKKTKEESHEVIHKCDFCNYSSTKRYLLARHLKSHSEERPYKCSICERGFKTQASLQNHVNTHTGNKPHKCSFCTSCFTTSGELVRHVRYRHTHEKPHKCTECDYASVELSKLKRHIRCHTGERPYQCPHCTYASPDTFKLKRHLRIHTGEKPYECDICHARFTQSNSLKAHKLIHSVGDKPVFQCELCPTTCGRKTDLRIHVQKLHTSDTPIKCRRCDKLFPDRYTYKVHSKTHDGEKCFKCEFCPYASISERHLESHMLIHTNQKPYECLECDQTFRQKQLLKRHINLYHNESYVPPESKPKTHQCPDCSRSFCHKGNMIRHMAIHDPDPSAKAQAIALKLGRRKKIEIVDDDGEIIQSVDENEEEYIVQDDGALDDIMEGVDNSTIIVKEEADQLISLQEEHNPAKQYVVLEVIHVYNQSSSVQNINDIENTETNHIADDCIFSVTDYPKVSDNDIRIVGKSLKEEILENDISQDQSEMEVCFGFDQEDIENDLDDNFVTDSKSTITLLHI